MQNISNEDRAMVKGFSLAKTSAVDLELLMKNRLTDFCHPFFNINKQMRKAFKSKLGECFKTE